MSPLDGIKFLAQNAEFLKVNAAWADLTMADFAARFSSPFLRRAFPLAFNSPYGLIMTLGWLSQKAAGFPLGGSLEFARAIERRFLGLGGQIHYDVRVAEILAEDGRACGLRLADGSLQRADLVISAADGHATLFDLLKGNYLNDDLQRYYKDFSLYDPLVYVTLGVARSFAGLPHWVVYPLLEPVEIGGRAQPFLGAEIYNFDPSLAPAGKTLIKCMFAVSYDYWKALAADPARYQAEKERIADWVVAQLDRHYPGLAAQVEMRDVATPLTWERYTANWRGSFEGWKMTKENTPPFRHAPQPARLEEFLHGRPVGGGWRRASRPWRFPAATSCRSSAKRMAENSQPPCLRKIENTIGDMLEIVPYNPAWPLEFERIRADLSAALGELAPAHRSHRLHRRDRPGRQGHNRHAGHRAGIDPRNR